MVWNFLNMDCVRGRDSEIVQFDRNCIARFVTWRSSNVSINHRNWDSITWLLTSRVKRISSIVFFFISYWIWTTQIWSWKLGARWRWLWWRNRGLRLILPCLGFIDHHLQTRRSRHNRERNWLFTLSFLQLSSLSGGWIRLADRWRKLIISFLRPKTLWWHGTWPGSSLHHCENWGLQDGEQRQTQKEIREERFFGGFSDSKQSLQREKIKSTKN